MNDILRKVTARKVLQYFLNYAEECQDWIQISSSVSKLKITLFNYTITVK